jgi:hypothetical protein
VRAMFGIDTDEARAIAADMYARDGDWLGHRC